MELSKTLLEQQPLMPLGAGSNRPQPNLSNYSEKPINKGSTGDYPLSVRCERMLLEMHKNA